VFTADSILSSLESAARDAVAEALRRARAAARAQPDAPSTGEADDDYLRTLEIDDASGRALVHWWCAHAPFGSSPAHIPCPLLHAELRFAPNYGSAHDHAQYVDCVCRYFPDSYDEWLPLSEIQGEPEPNPAPPPQWHVFARYAPLCPPQQRP
jgi:hypothetical protein